MRRLDLILIKVPYSSRSLGLEKQNKELTKFIGAPLRSLPDPSCDLLLYTSLIPYFFSVSGRRLSRCLPKDPSDEKRGADAEKFITGAGSRRSLLWAPQPQLGASCNPPRKPIPYALAVKFPENFFPRAEKGVSETRARDRGQQQGGIFELWLGPTLNGLTSGIPPLVGSARDTGQRGDIEVLVVAAGLWLQEWEGEGLGV